MRPRSPRWRRLTVLGLLLAAADGVAQELPAAADGDPATGTAAAEASAAHVIAAFHAAFAGEDRDAKRTALRALLDARLPDAVVLPLLVDAVADRQAHDDAIAALRERTGLTPPVFLGQSDYPGYPASDHPASWQHWLACWRADHERQVAIATVLAETVAALQDAVAAEAAVRAAHAQSTVSTPTSSRAQP